MSDLIQWPRAQYWDKPWNPIVGCNPISPACENCYAAAWAKRFGQSFKPHQSSKTRPPRKGVVFCGNLTDLFGEWMWPWNGPHDGYIVRSPEDLIRLACGKTHNDALYLWLTKRVHSMVDAVQRAFYEKEWLKTRRYCHYFGFTAEDQQRYAERLLPVYRAKEKWMQFWVSAEPLLGPLRLGLDGDLIPGTYQWLVVGCESGPKRRPCKIEWVESIVAQCRTAGVPVFVKQLDIGGKCERDITKFPKHLQIRQVPWAKNGGAQ
jgi:protein gp37